MERAEGGPARVNRTGMKPSDAFDVEVTHPFEALKADILSLIVGLVEVNCRFASEPERLDYGDRPYVFSLEADDMYKSCRLVEGLHNKWNGIGAHVSSNAGTNVVNVSMTEELFNELFGEEAIFFDEEMGVVASLFSEIVLSGNANMTALENALEISGLSDEDHVSLTSFLAAKGIGFTFTGVNGSAKVTISGSSLSKLVGYAEGLLENIQERIGNGVKGIGGKVREVITLH